MKQPINTKTLLPLMALLFAGTASAAPVGGVPADAGFINFEPGSPFYAVETTVEPVFQDKETTLKERAAEYTESAEDNPEGASQALQALQSTAEGSNKNQTEALQQAYNAVNSAPTPEEAQQGIQTALNSIQQAQNREPPKKGIMGNIPGQGQESEEGEQGSQSGQLPEDVGQRALDIAP